MEKPQHPNEEKPTSSEKEIKLNWDDLKKGIIAEKEFELALTPEALPIKIPVNKDDQKEKKGNTAAITELEEIISNISPSDIPPIAQYIEAEDENEKPNNTNKEAPTKEDDESESFRTFNLPNEAPEEIKKQQEIEDESFRTFNLPNEAPEEIKKQQEIEDESWNRPSGTEAGFEEKEEADSPMFAIPFNPESFNIPKDQKPLEDQDESVFRPDSFPIIEEEKPLEDQDESVSFGVNIPKEVEVIAETEEAAPPMPKPKSEKIKQEAEEESAPKKTEEDLEKENQKIEEESAPKKTEEDLEKEKAENQLKERLEEVKAEIEKKKSEIEKIIPGFLDKFGLSEKSKTKEILSKELAELEKEKTEIEKKLGITTETETVTEETEHSKESLTEKIYSFIKREGNETENIVEKLPPEKQTLFKKIKTLSKDRKVQAAVIGSMLLGVSIAVPPIGGAAWLTGGLVSGFLPVSMGIPLKVLGGATAGLILRGSGVGISTLRKVIENRKASTETESVEEEKEEPSKTTKEEINEEAVKEDSKEKEEQRERLLQANRLANEARTNKIKAEELAKSGKKEDLEKLDFAEKEFEKAFAEFVREMYSLAEKTGQTPNEIIAETFKTKKSENPETKEEKKRIIEEIKRKKIEIPLEEKLELIKNADNFSELYSSLKKIAEEGINPETIISDVEHIREIIKNSGENEKAKIYMADCFTGDVGEQQRDNKFASKTDIPEIYGINDKINSLLKEEIQKAEKEKKKTDKEEDKDEEEKRVVFAPKTFLDLYQLIKKERENGQEIANNIEEIRKRIDSGKDILEIVQKIPDDYLPTVMELIEKEKKTEKSSSKIENFDTLYKSGITEEEKADIKKIRLGQEKADVLKNTDLQEKVIALIERDTQTVSEVKNIESLYDAIDEICKSGDTQNSFSSQKIKESIKNCMHPNPKYPDPEKTLEEVPEIYGIREKVKDLIKKESSEKPLTKTEIEKNPKKLVDKKESIAERIQKIVAEKDNLKTEKKNREEEMDEKGISKEEELENILKETTDVEEFRDTVNEIGEDGDSLAVLLQKMIESETNELNFDDFPEEYGIREAAIRIVME